MKEQPVMKKTFERRDFLKWAGLGSAAAGMTLFDVDRLPGPGFGEFAPLSTGSDGGGGFSVQVNKSPYKMDAERLGRMSEAMNMFGRNTWDPVRRTRPELSENLAYERLVVGGGNVPNQTRLDYALSASSWHLARLGRGADLYGWTNVSGTVRGYGLSSLDAWDPGEQGMSWEEASLAVKHAACFYGASEAGIAALNPLWVYGEVHVPRPNDRRRTVPVVMDGDRFGQEEDAWYIPGAMNRVIALAFEEDYWGIANSPGQLASAAVGDGYSRMAVTASTLSQFIRGLGYRAIPSGNNLGLSIPIAIDAGLGEHGRNGLLVTPRYGPRVRLAKVITDMPLVPDAPISFGVTEFCESCMLCAETCPSGSIPTGVKTWEGPSPSNNPGAFKWYIQPESCYDYNGFSCSNCKRSCPFSKPNNSWLHRLIRTIIEGRVKPVDAVMVKLDQATGYGRQLQATDFWKKKARETITSRDPE